MNTSLGTSTSPCDRPIYRSDYHTDTLCLYFRFTCESMDDSFLGGPLDRFSPYRFSRLPNHLLSVHFSFKGRGRGVRFILPCFGRGLQSARYGLLRSPCRSGIPRSKTRQGCHGRPCRRSCPKTMSFVNYRNDRQ